MSYDNKEMKEYSKTVLGQILLKADSGTEAGLQEA